MYTDRSTYRSLGTKQLTKHPILNPITNNKIRINIRTTDKPA